VTTNAEKESPAMTNDKSTDTKAPSAEKPAVPFFARKVARANLTVRAGVRAGRMEQEKK
jgi:hypothetical protein